MCYLIAEHEFGFFNNPNSRLVLVGGDHKTKSGSFAKNVDSLQRTEIVEFSKMLSNSQFMIPQIQGERRGRERERRGRKRGERRRREEKGGE